MIQRSVRLVGTVEKFQCAMLRSTSCKACYESIAEEEKKFRELPVVAQKAGIRYPRHLDADL